MRLATKLMLVFFLAIAVVTGVYGYLAVKREEQLFAARAEAEVRRIAATIEPSLRGMWRTQGPERVVALLQQMPLEGYNVRVRWVWFDAPRTDPFGPMTSWERRSQPAQLVEIRNDGVGNLYAYWPLDFDTARRGGLEFAYPLTQLQEARREAIVETLRLLLALFSVSALTVVFAGVTMVGSPLRQLIEKTRQIAEGNLQDPLQLNTGDELSELAASLNALCTKLAESEEQVRQETSARITALEQLRHADRLQTVGRLASGIAHELGTPLNVISGRAGLIADNQLPPERVIESASTIKHETERMTKIIRQLLDYARRGEPQRTQVEVGSIAEQTIELLTPLAGDSQVTLQLRRSEASAAAEVDVAQIQQVLINVLMNAIQASESGSSVEVSVEPINVESAADIQPELWIQVVVSDQGEGISKEDQRHIFDPFFTTKEVGEGTGLGLSIAHRILEEHGGRIEVDSEPGQGTQFRILLPSRQVVEPTSTVDR